MARTDLQEQVPIMLEAQIPGEEVKLLLLKIEKIIEVYLAIVCTAGNVGPEDGLFRLAVQFLDHAA